MTQDEIIRMAREAGIYQPERFDSIDGGNQLERFAALVAEATKAKQAKMFAEKASDWADKIAQEREALAQPQGEPVAWMNDSTPMGIFAKSKEGAENFGCTIPLYTTPPSVEVEQGEGTAQELDGCPTEKAVLQRFWRGQPIPQEHYPEWYTSVEAAIEATKEKAAKVLDKQIIKLKQVLEYCEADEADAIKSTAWQLSVLATEIRGIK